MNSGPIEVSTYEAPRAPEALVSSDAEHRRERCAPPSGLYSSAARGSRRHLTIGAAAAFVSLALHALLVTAMLWGTGSSAPRPRDAGALDAVAPEAADDGALQVLFVQDPSDAPPTITSANPAISSPSLVAIAAADAFANGSPSIPDVSVDATSTVPTPAPDAALRSALYGRYVGQIDARIERAWRRPRTGIGAPTFACLVRVDQDSRGAVQEVTLEQCNGSERWQHSLVSAIESASPLPAPPDPAVFTRILHLSFQSPPYSASAPRDAYEPSSVAEHPAGPGAVDEPSEEEALTAFGRALRDAKSGQAISLTLNGHPAARPAAGSLQTSGISPPAVLAPPARPAAE